MKQKRKFNMRADKLFTLQSTVNAVHQMPLNFEVTKSVRIELTGHVLLSKESKHYYRVLIRAIPLCCYIITIYQVSKKIKHSHYRPGGAHRVPGSLIFPDFMTTAQDGGKVVSLTHRLPLSLTNAPGTHFCQMLSRPQDHSEIGRILC